MLLFMTFSLYAFQIDINSQEMAWRKDVNLTEWIHHYTIRRYGVDAPELKKVWDILLPSVYHNKAHLGLQLTKTQFTDIAAAYHVMLEVGMIIQFIQNYFQYVRSQKDTLSEPLQYDVVDLTRQYFQNAFSEVLRAFGATIKECYPFTQEYEVFTDSDSGGNDIKHMECKDETGVGRKCTVEELMMECNKYRDCGGFNTNGWLKASVNPSGGVSMFTDDDDDD